MEVVNLQTLIPKYQLLDEQAWALCFKSVKYIQTMYGSLIDQNNSRESVFCNLTLGSVELMEDGEIIVDLKLGNAAEENQEAAVKDDADKCPESLRPASMKETGGSGSTSPTLMVCSAESPLSSTGGGSSFLDDLGKADDLPYTPVRFRSKFERLRYEEAQAKKQQEAAKMMRIPSGANRPANIKGTDGSKSTSTVMGFAASPLPSTRGGSRVVDNTGTGDLPGPQVRFRSKFDRLRHEAQVKPEEEKAEPPIGTPRRFPSRPSPSYFECAIEPEISGKAEAEVVLALGKMIRESMKSTPKGDHDRKLHALIARMTGDIAKRLPLQRISKECEIHAKWEGEFRYTCILRDLVSYYQVFIERSIGFVVPDQYKPVKKVMDNIVSEDSSGDSDGSGEEVIPSSPSESLHDTDEELGNTVTEMQDTNKNDTIINYSLGADDVEKDNIQHEPVEIKSEVKKTAEKDQDGDDSDILSQEEPSKEKSDDPCSKLQTDTEEDNIPTKPGEIKREVMNPALSEKVQHDSDNSAVSQGEPSEEKGHYLCGEDTREMQTTMTTAESGSVTTKPTGNEDEQQEVKQENQEQQESACQPTNKSDKPSVIVNWGNVPEVWCANQTVQQMKKTMGIDQGKVNVPKRNWTKTTPKRKADNTQVEATKPVPVNSTANAEGMIKNKQANEKVDTEPADKTAIPMTVNWGDVPEQWSAKMTVQQVKAKMGIKEERVERPKKILEQKKETIMKPHSAEVDIKSEVKKTAEKNQDGDDSGTLSQEEPSNEKSDDPCSNKSQNNTTKNGIGELVKSHTDAEEDNIPTKPGEIKYEVMNPALSEKVQLDDDNSTASQGEPSEPADKTAIPPMTVNWGDVPEQWSAKMTVQQVKAKMGIKEESVERPKKILEQKKETIMKPYSEEVGKSGVDCEQSAPVTIQLGNISETLEAKLTVDQLKAKMGINETKPPLTVLWGNEPEQWAAQLNVAQVKKKMGIREKKVTRPRKNSNKKVLGFDQAVATQDKKPEGLEEGKDFNIIDAAKQETTVTSGNAAEKSEVPSVSNLPSRGERLSKKKLEKIKAQLLAKPSVPKTTTRKAKEEVKKPRTESELLQLLSASNRPKDAGYFKSMLNKAGTYLNPFQWTKAKAEPATDSSSLNAGVVQSDLTSKKSWLPSGVSKFLLQAADASVYAGLAYCGVYNVLGMETALDLALIYSNLTSKPSVGDCATTIIASQAAGFYFSPNGQSYFHPK